MALDAQTVSVPFVGGVSTKEDPKQIGPGKLAALENAVFTSPKRLKKRNGLVALGGPLDGAALVASFKDELVAGDGKRLYSYGEARGEWVDRGPLVPVQVSARTVVPVVPSHLVSGYSERLRPDCVRHPAGVTVAAWLSGMSTSLEYVVLDSSTGVVLHRGTGVGEARSIKLAVVGDYVLILVSATGSSGPDYRHVQCYAINAVGGAGFGVTSVTTLPEVPSPAVFDACTTDAGCFIAYGSSSGTSLRVYRISSLLAVSGPAAIFGASACHAVALGRHPVSGTDAVLVWSTGTKLSGQIVSAGLVCSSFADTLVSVSYTKKIGLACNGIRLGVFYTLPVIGEPACDEYVCALSCEFTGSEVATGEPVTLMRSVGLAAKPATVGGVTYVPVTHESTLQGTVFLLSVEDLAQMKANVAARVLPTSAAPRTDVTILPETTVDADGLHFPAPKYATYTTHGTDSQGVVEIRESSVVLISAKPGGAVHRVEIADALHLATGGLLAAYDGVSLVEHGFHLFPERVKIVSGAGTDRWQFKFCYVWKDAQGKEHYSSPSQQDIATDHLAQTISLPTLRVTGKDDVGIAVFRTEKNGTSFHRVTIAANNTSLDYVPYPANTPDEEIIGNPKLEFLLGTIENVAPGSVRHIGIHRRRVFAVDGTESDSLPFSKQVAAGVPVEFSPDLLALRVDPRGGAVTATASLDDKLVIFKRDRLFFVTGQGPDGAGAQDDFLDPQLVTSDVGCINPRSIVTVPGGLMFQSAKGIYLLDRGLAATYVGHEVEAYNGATVTSATLVGDANQVRFTLDSGVTLVYDYLVGQWGTFDVAAVDGCVHRGRFTVIASHGQVLQESDETHADADMHVPLKLATGWLQFAGLQGFQRVREMLILGEYASAHQLRVSIAYDFDPTPAQVETVTPTSTPPYQWRVHLARQKCQALQVTIEDVDSGTAGESLSLSGLTFEVGVKRGPNRMSAARSVG